MSISKAPVSAEEHNVLQPKVAAHSALHCCCSGMTAVAQKQWQNVWNKCSMTYILDSSGAGMRKSSGTPIVGCILLLAP